MMPVRFALAVLVVLGSLCAHAHAKQPTVQQKQPQRSPDAVRTATRLGLTGYQGPSVTKKGAKPTR